MVEITHGGRRWVPLKAICEANHIPYRYRLTRVIADPRIESTKLPAPSRKGAMLKMICIPVEQVEMVLSMPCPGPGAHNQTRQPYRRY